MKKGLIIAIIIVVVILLIGFVASKVLSIFPIIRGFTTGIDVWEQQRQKYIEMTTEELSALEDEELFEAIEARVDDEILLEENADIVAKLKSVNKEKRVFYTAYWFESELQNGGLCQYFCNSSNLTAPYLSEALETIGAKEQKVLFDEFVKDNDINVNDLSMFETDDIDEYIEKTKLLDFDSFDNSYYALDESVSNVYDLLKIYARENIESF